LNLLSYWNLDKTSKMDGISSASAILALVGAADTAVSTFATFIKGVKIVDATISNFLREVQTLLKLIRAIIQKVDELPSALIEEGGLMGLWESTKETLAECSKTVKKLKRLFRRLNKESGGFAQAAVKQFKLQFQGQEIAGLRERIASLQRNFQTAMGAMSV